MRDRELVEEVKEVKEVEFSTSNPFFLQKLCG